METEIKELSDIYDDLYERGQKVIDTFNPCEVSNGKCASKDGNFCCQSCPYLGDTGCKTKSMWCKLWLCFSRSSEHKECEKQLNKMRSLSFSLGVQYGR